MRIDAHDIALVAEIAQREGMEYILDRPLDRKTRLELAAKSLEFFARFYLHEHFTRPPAQMHRAVYKRLETLMNTPGRANVVFVLPRGFAKTTIATLALPLWCICFGKRKHIPIISDSFPQAKDQLENLKREIEDNDRLIEDFGELQGPVWQSADIETKNGVRIRALGQGMKLRGRKYHAARPDLIILDDIEELEGVQSQTQRDALYNWFTRTVMRAGWDETKIVVLGNFLHADCLLARLARNPMFDTYIYSALKSWPQNMHLWDEWQQIITNAADLEKEKHAREFFEAHKEEMLKGAESSWPEVFPVYDLMVIRVTGGDTSFQTELQNDISDPERRVFKHWFEYDRRVIDGEEWLIPHNGAAVKLKDCILYAATDPSLGKSSSADPSAITIIARTPTNYLLVLVSDVRIRTLDRLLADQIQLASRYPISRWGIEANQFQAMFASRTAELARSEQVQLPVVPITHIGNKTMRIQSLEPDITNGIIQLPRHGADVLKRELSHWPLSATDDALDSLEVARSLAGGWLPHQVSEVIQADVYDFAEPEEGETDEEDAIYTPITVWR